MPAVIIAPEQLPPWALRTEIPTVVADMCEDACDLAVWRAIRWLIALSGRDRLGVDARTIAAHAKVDVKTALRCINGDSPTSTARRRPRTTKRGLVGLGLLELAGHQPVGKLKPRPVYRIPAWIEEQNAHHTREFLTRTGLEPPTPAPPPAQTPLPLAFDPISEQGVATSGLLPPMIVPRASSESGAVPISDQGALLPARVADPIVAPQANSGSGAVPISDQGTLPPATTSDPIAALHASSGSDAVPISDQAADSPEGVAAEPDEEQQRWRPTPPPPGPWATPVASPEDLERSRAWLFRRIGPDEEAYGFELPPRFRNIDPHTGLPRVAATTPEAQRPEPPARSRSADPNTEQRQAPDPNAEDNNTSLTPAHSNAQNQASRGNAPDPYTDQGVPSPTRVTDPNSVRRRDGTKDGGGEGLIPPPQNFAAAPPTPHRPAAAPAALPLQQVGAPPPAPPTDAQFAAHQHWVPGILPAHPLDLWRRACVARRPIDDDQLAVLASEHDPATGGYGWYWVGRAILAAALSENIQSVAKVRRTLDRWRAEDAYGSDAPTTRRAPSSSPPRQRSGAEPREEKVPLSVRLGVHNIFKEY